MRELLIWLGFIEAEPRGTSLPAWIYLVLGMITIVLGTGLIVSGELVVGVVVSAFGAINGVVAISKRRLDAGRGSARDA